MNRGQAAASLAIALAASRRAELKTEVDRLSAFALKNEYWHRKYKRAFRAYKVAVVYEIFVKREAMH